VQPEDNNREQQRNRVKKHIIFLSFWGLLLKYSSILMVESQKV
jgi:hypothetical protein